MATLFHWDLPQALQDTGGWESRDVAFRFADYAEAVFDALGDAVPDWLTINEPKTVVQNGYLHGHHAPGHRDPDAAYLVAHHLQLAHGLAVRALRAHRLGGPHRAGAQPAPVLPRRRQRRRAAAAPILHDGYENRLYLDSDPSRTRTRRTCSTTSARTAGWSAGSATATSRSSRRPVDLLAVQYYTPVLRHRRRRHRAAVADLRGELAADLPRRHVRHR